MGEARARAEKGRWAAKDLSLSQTPVVDSHQLSELRGRVFE